MLTTVLAYSLIVIFFVIERRMRIGQEAKSLERGPSDRGSTSLIGLALIVSVLALLGAPILGYLHIGTLPFSVIVGWLGISLGLLGLAVRVWAFKTLGQFYTRTLRHTENQHVVQEGPYRFIRHPGYVGVLLIFLGAALATTNWITFGIIALAMFTAYHYRIQTEEDMLMTALGKEYGDYRAQTRRLIPFIY